ncbi:hypothetical protein [Synechococcus sp. CS-1328]|uniref:hypothetical protein n=1 Tax=Synechococcus sp. CS-1328 TaxID=2847976 RepID=UPI00223C0C92|nr:hypothetical protein [Synechococcus sp. CS-1328]MCT0225597.1 hypothetical protein [Synechococcus sp. CS-1328]
MRFYAVRTDAIQQTHRALQQMEQRRRGSSRPSRALRVAQLYGHLQCRAKGGCEVQLGLRELATSWHLQPRELRADLQDLEAIGWLTYRSGPAGMRIQLAEPAMEGSAPAVPERTGLSAETPRVEAPKPSASGEPDSPDESLIAQFAAVYNRHRPGSWPAYSPRGSALTVRLRRAIAHAGSAEAFWRCLEQALSGMPPFWRRTYPQGRSGAQCAAGLFCVDRHCAGLGVEFWHVFAWAQASGVGVASAANGSGNPGDAALPQAEHDFARANRLLLWDGHLWRGQGVEALKLERSEKRRLAELLEAAGQGIPGAAAEQYAGPAEA